MSSKKMSKNLQMHTKSLFGKVWYYISVFSDFRPDDIIVTSFPKSGNTWFRYFLCNLFSEIYLGGKPVTFQELDDLMPALGHQSFSKKWKYKNYPRFVKTHMSKSVYFSRKRSILLIRDPRDVMVSYFHYANNLKIFPDFSSFSTFIKHPKFGLRNWVKHYNSWNGSADLILSYEDLKEDDLKHFKKVVDLFNISCTKEQFTNAVVKSRFKNFKKIEEQFGTPKPDESKDSFKFVRKGAVGDYVNYFSESDIIFYNSIISALKSFPEDYRY